MCRFLVAAIAALLSVPVSASAAEITATASPVVTRGTTPPVVARGEPNTSWVALAVSTNGRVFQSESFNSEASARGAALSECEHTSGRTCRDSMSVPNEWDVIVLRCGNQNFLGGSGQKVAYENALAKAVNRGFSAGDCRQIASY
jgi:Domain of unknown function (DUF4189)